MQIKVFSIITALLICLSVNSCAEGFLQEAINSANKTISKFNYSNNAGATEGDWFALADCVINEKTNGKYLAELSDYVDFAYRENGGLSNTKSTEYSRIALCILATGGDPCAVGKSEANLLRDGVANFKNLSMQGINGAIFGLIATKSGGYRFNKNAIYDENELINIVLQYQNKDGGFSLQKGKSEVDVSAMAITALSRFKDKTNVNRSIESAINYLSKVQNKDGSFSLYGVKNCESTAQAIIAMCSNNINPITDIRFVKSDNSINALLSFEVKNGGFSHITGGELNNLASEQACLAIGAYKRYSENGYLFDFKGIKSDNGFRKERIFIYIGAGALIICIAALLPVKRKKK